MRVSLLLGALAAAAPLFRSEEQAEYTEASSYVSVSAHGEVSKCHGAWERPRCIPGDKVKEKFAVHHANCPGGFHDFSCCEAKPGASREEICPQNCEGKFEPTNQCLADESGCDTKQTLKYVIVKKQIGKGKACPHQLDETKEIDCPCNRKCEGEWEMTQDCDCDNNKVEKISTFKITKKQSGNGMHCSDLEGDTKAESCNCPTTTTLATEEPTTTTTTAEIDNNIDLDGMTVKDSAVAASVTALFLQLWAL